MMVVKEKVVVHLQLQGHQLVMYQHLGLSKQCRVLLIPDP